MLLNCTYSLLLAKVLLHREKTRLTAAPANSRAALEVGAWKTSIGTYFSQFLTHEQQDAHEYLILVLDTLHEEFLQLHAVMRNQAVTAAITPPVASSGIADDSVDSGRTDMESPLSSVADSCMKGIP